MNKVGRDEDLSSDTQGVVGGAGAQIIICRPLINQLLVILQEAVNFKRIYEFLYFIHEELFVCC